MAFGLIFLLVFAGIVGGLGFIIGLVLKTAAYLAPILGIIFFAIAAVFIILMIVLYKKRIYGNQKKIPQYIDTKPNVKYYIAVICEIMNWIAPVFLVLSGLIFILAGKFIEWIL